MSHIKTEIIIDAKPSEIWKVLTDFDDYKNWNPLIIESIGKAVKGTKLQNTLKIKNKEQSFRPKITVVKANKHLEWLGSLGIKGIFDGRHYFIIEELPNGQCMFVQGEHFSGILCKLILKSIRKDTLNGFVAMNDALKARVESIN